MQGICALCHKETDLKMSHIIPSFVYKWHKAQLGPLRDSKNPNLRIQDGYKKHLLCGNCEKLFHKFEDSFKKTLFDPLYTQENPPLQFKYDHNMLKFCVSLSWRVIEFLKSEPEYTNHPTNIKNIIGDVSLVWRDFLLDNIKNPKQYKQYVILLDKAKASAGWQLPEFLSTYFLSSCDLDICYSNSSIYVYAKIYQILIVSVLKIENKKHFQAENIHVTRGNINKVYNIALPSDFVQHLFNHCQQTFSARHSLSEKQQKIINEYILNNQSKLIGNKAFLASLEDLGNHLKNK